MDSSLPKLAWKSSCGTYTVKIKRPAFKQMLRLAAQHAPVEVGTSLVGSYSDDGLVAIVHRLAPLTGDSKGTRFSFLRGVMGLQSFFGALYHRFSGRRHYVGEWHSHPDAEPRPSPTDDDNQTQIASDNATDCPECILVILGGHLPDAPHLGVFIYSRRNGRVELHPQH